MNFAIFPWVLTISSVLAGCAAPIAKMECQEIRSRLQFQELSDDQKRFAEQELEDCEKNIQMANQKDSTLLKKIERNSAIEDEL